MIDAARDIAPQALGLVALIGLVFVFTKWHERRLRARINRRAFTGHNCPRVMTLEERNDLARMYLLRSQQSPPGEFVRRPEESALALAGKVPSRSSKLT